jgi:hydroxyethylthiazole kinase-like uncharacterized protein yjeF
MKIFNGDQIKSIDHFTIENEPVKSIDLMERAANKILGWLVNKYERPGSFVIFAGLALARLLKENRYNVEVHYVSFTDNVSADWAHNYRELESDKEIPINIIKEAAEFPLIRSGQIIVDSIFGTGLTRPAEGLAAEVIRRINSTGNTTISIDMPSGLFSEDNSDNIPDNIIMADYTLSFQFPKLSFMFAENYRYTGNWHILDIGLHPACIRDTVTPYYVLERKEVSRLLHERAKFDHKGVFGHGLLIAGSKGKIGAAILGARAALRTGIGLITCHVPADSGSAIHAAVAEVMLSYDRNEDHLTFLPDLAPYNSIGIGPGLGTDDDTSKAVKELFSLYRKPVVIDADAINILGTNNELLFSMPASSILTPHIKEFERIAGTSGNGYQRLLKQIEFSRKNNCMVVLKGAQTSVSMPDGSVFFNTTGNPGMATAGSGDVLTGMILSLLSQGYSSEHAAVAGVFLHGLAGDIAAHKLSLEALMASDIIENIGNAFNMIRNQTYNHQNSNIGHCGIDQPFEGGRAL